VYRIEYLPSYSDDLDTILYHLAITQKSRRAAEVLLEALDAAIQQLGEHPRRYRRYFPVIPLGTEYRIIGVKGNAVFFTIDNEAQLVEIHRILNGHCDYDQWLA